MQKKNNYYFGFWTLAIISLGVTSCTPFCCREATVIPENWHACFPEMSLKNPACFQWWKALNDPILTELVEQATLRNPDVRLAKMQSKEKHLEAINGITAEVGKTYIQLRGAQSRLILSEAKLHIQEELLEWNKGLTNTGFSSVLEQNESEKLSLNLVQLEAQLEQTIQTLTTHLVTLLNYPRCQMDDLLSDNQVLPLLPCEIPVGTPCNFMQVNLAIAQARKCSSGAWSQAGYYLYQKTYLSEFEKMENALISFQTKQQALQSVEKIKQLKQENFALIQDLQKRGIKDDLSVQAAYLELLMVEEERITLFTDLIVDYITIYQTIGFFPTLQSFSLEAKLLK